MTNQIPQTCDYNGPRAKRVWALDADLAAAFDKIRSHPTEEGTPQGGVISPLLLNVALHGLEHAAGVRYITAGRQAGDTKAGSPVVIRYADDMVALATASGKPN